MEHKLPPEGPLSVQSLTQLALMHQKLYVEGDTTENHHTYDLLLGAATVATTANTPTDVVLTLARYRFDFFRRMISYDKPTTTGLLYKAELIRDNLVVHGLVQRLACSEEDGNIMAWLCLMRIAEIENMGWSLEPSDVDMLTQWWGSSYTQGELPSLAQAVELVYGPGVWELYATDVAFTADVPNHLYRLGVPAVCPAANQRSGLAFDSSDVLPGNYGI